MKKRGFVTVFVLLLLLVLSITISFIFNQNQNDLDFNKDLYDKKQALYISESVANLAIEDKGFYEYKEKLYKSIKDYYRKSKYEETKVEENKVGEIKSYYPEIRYDGKIYKPKVSYITNIKRLRLESIVSVGETQARTEMDYEVKSIFDFFKEEPIKYDFKEDIEFKTLNLKEDPYILELDNTEEKFYKINNNLIIEDVNENNIEQDSVSENESSNETLIYENHKDSNANKSFYDDENNNIEQFIDVNTIKQKKKNYKGIMYIRGDLILLSDFSMEGLLIVDGKIKNEINNNDREPKLSIKGQVISSTDLKKVNLDYKYDKESYKYIEDIEKLFKVEPISKRVY